MTRLISIIAIILFSSITVMAQVGDVNKNVEKDKKKKSENNTTASFDSGNSSSSGGWFGGFLIEIFSATIGAAQYAALENVEYYPERISLEIFAQYGTGINLRADYFQTGVRGNWGIIATDFKYVSLRDATGDLKTIDWSVLVFRIPIQNFKLDYGIGFIGIISQDQSYFNSSLGFDLRLPNLGVNINAAYQWSEKTSLGSRFKKGFVVKIDYEIIGQNKLHLSPMIEYANQTYFEETSFSLVSAGVIFRIY